MVRVPSFLGSVSLQSSEVGACEISSQFNLHVGTTDLADFTAVSFTLGHLDHGLKAFSMLSIGGTIDKAGVAWNSTTLREKVAPAFVLHIHLVAVGFSFSSCVPFAISDFGCLDILFDEFKFLVGLISRRFIFSEILRSGAISWDPHYSTNVA